MEPWAIAMMCATVLIGMGTCGACCHKGGKSYITAKEAKLRDRALGRAKELVHMGAHGADKLLQDVQTYHNMRDRNAENAPDHATAHRGKVWRETMRQSPMLRLPKAKTHYRRFQQQQAAGNNHHRKCGTRIVASPVGS
jgi:hypothetical protein